MISEMVLAPPGSRLLVPDLLARESLADYRKRGGYATASLSHTPEGLLDLIEASGLCGRGGAQRPSGPKWRTVAAQPGPRVVLVNVAESEPASRKDRQLLALRPHLVIEGTLLAAHAIGADTCVFYVHAGDRAAHAALELARRELCTAGWRLPRWRVVAAPSGYVAGEQSAAVQCCNGKPAKPTFKPPLPAERGVGHRPTLVHNAETLAHVPFIAREGAAAFRAIGSPDLPGTLLVTLSGAVARPGVYEVPSGTRLDWLLAACGGGSPGNVSFQAVLPGGYFAGWLSGQAVQEGARLEAASLRPYGVQVGSGAVTVVPETVCGLWQAVALLRFFARESVQQCGACTFGTQAMADALQRLALGQAANTDLERLRGYAELILPKRGACGHLDGAAIAARTALRVFADEIDRHARTGDCGRSRQVLLPGLEEDHGISRR